MAKKKKSSKKKRIRIIDKKRDAQTKQKIEELAEDVVSKALKQREPNFEIPTRSISNMKYNRKKRILEMGSCFYYFQSIL